MADTHYNDAADGLPYVQRVTTDGEGRKRARVDPVRRAQVKHRFSPGYQPIRPVIGISFADDDERIAVVRPPAPRHPIELLDDPISEDEAFATLTEPFSRLDPRYLRACLAAVICGDARLGRPPMLACTKPSGTGKEQTIRLAASFVGDDICTMPLTDDEEKFSRTIGAAVTSGRRFLVLDEVGKTRNLSAKLKNILQISSHVSWRPLYQTNSAQTPTRAAIYLPCTRFPDFFTGSAEVNRRVRHIHLHRRLPDWEEASGGDTAEWRDRSTKNAFLANSILTHTWRLCHEYGFRF